MTLLYVTPEVEEARREELRSGQLVECESCGYLGGSSPCLACRSCPDCGHPLGGEGHRDCQSVSVSAEDMLRAVLSAWYGTGVPPFSLAETVWAVEDFLGEA